MKSLLVLVTILAILFLLIILLLMRRICVLNKKIKYVDEANMWHKLAVTDDLTGVYNRNAYNLYITEIKKRTKKSLAGIILFDIDNFKIINDTKGHLEGDTVLKKTARLLAEVFGGKEYRVFRIGGDEFAILTENADEIDILDRLNLLNKKLSAKGYSRLSKGYAFFTDSPESAFESADEMLYSDKMSKKFRNAFCKHMEAL